MIGLKELWSTCAVRKGWERKVKYAADRLRKHQHIYKSLQDVTGIDWQVIAVIHKMESNCDFKAHLHNGDPLTNRTVHVPRNRPAHGYPPYSFVESAVDALDEWVGITNDINHTLDKIERYNGLGYRYRGINSPYLWSGTYHYGDGHNVGKFVSDGKFDKNAISKQIGCVPVLKELGYMRKEPPSELTDDECLMLSRFRKAIRGFLGGNNEVQ